MIEIDPTSIPWKSMYKLMVGSIVPRPIGWISTLSEIGIPNLAPFSFFNAVCANPPTVLFCPGIRAIDHQPKDTLINVERSREFVVNIVSLDQAQAMNVTSTDFPADVNEFTMAGLQPIPSVRVKPPRVGGSPIQFECFLDRIVEISTDPGGASVVIGRICYVHVQEDLLLGGDKIDIPRLEPVGRLAGNGYCYVDHFFEMVRPVSQIVNPGG